MKNYHDLEVYKIAFDLAIRVHKISLQLPKYELYEEGSQIRRSSKSICSCIVEGYGRRRYKNDFIRYLVFAQASCDEAILHIDFIHSAGHLDEETYIELKDEFDKLGRKLNKFIQYVDKHWNLPPTTE